MRTRSSVTVLLGLCLVLTTATGVTARAERVRCDRGADLQVAIDQASPGVILDIRGTCRGDFSIDGKDLTFRGTPGAVLRGTGASATLSVERADVRLVRLAVTGGQDGVSAWWGARITLLDSAIRDNAGEGLRGDVSTYRLVGSRVRDNGGSGIWADGHGLRVELIDSIIRRNAFIGVFANQVEALRSRIAHNGGPGISTIDQGYVSARRLIVRANGGGGISSRGIDLADSTIEDNQGSGIRGGWFVDPGWVRIRGSVVRRNHGDGDGGGLACHGGCLVVDSRFSGNTAAGNGGGIWVHIYANGAGTPASLTVRRSSIVGNRAGSGGGGIHNASSLDVVLTKVVLRHNRPNDCVGC